MAEFGGRTVNELSLGYDCDVDRVTGRATLRVPVPLPPGRNGFGPAFSLVYSSSGESSPFGVGWALTGLPTIGLDSREHVPRWDGSDGYQLSGDELVPWLELDGDAWRPRGFTAGDWSVAFLRSRVGGPQIRVEKWVHRTTGWVHFRARDPRDAVTVFGARPDGRSRISDPDDDSRTFLWLPEVQVDPLGNAVWFEYEPETLDGVDRSVPYERRGSARAQRYLKRIRYANAQPVSLTDDVVAGVLPPGVRWCVQSVLDYGDHSDPDLPDALPDRAWPARLDPFSACRPGFEVRTHRLCRRVLSFHDFDELGPGPTLVGALVLTHDESASGSTLEEIAYVGHRGDGAERTSRALPPLRMTYAAPSVAETFAAAPAETRRNLPAGLAGAHGTFVDLFGEGLPGMLEETESAWLYKANEGEGRFGEQVLVLERPSTRPGAWSFGDVDRDGNQDLSQLTGRTAGRFSHDRDAGRWDGFRPFDALPHVEGIRRAQWVDLNGDGRPDIVIPNGDRLTWFASEGEEFADPVEVPLPAHAIPTVAENPMLDLFFADMNGDGLVDLVRVGNGRVEYWPSLGNGRFGEAVLLDGSPRFAPEDEFDAARVRFVDLDGSGTSDLVYLGRGEVTIWRNELGNRIAPGPRLDAMPFLDSVSTVGVLDFLGDGRPCLVWSNPLPGAESPLSYLPLAGPVAPRLLLWVDDSMGQETRFTYASSAAHYLRDRRAGEPWRTRLPRHVPVVDRREVVDAVGGTRSVQRLEYRDGFFDGVERRFRGFGRVDVYDRVLEAEGPEEGVAATPPSLVRTWAHVGGATRSPPAGAYGADPELPWLPPHVVDAAELTAEEVEDAERAVAGRVVRTEMWAVGEDGTRAEHPFEVHQTSFRVLRAQPARRGARPAFDVLAEESLAAVYEGTGGDPRVTHTVTIETDAFGLPRLAAEIAYARRAGSPREVAAQGETTVLVHETDLVHLDTDERFELGVPVAARDFELTGLAATAGRITPEDLRGTDVSDALAAPVAHHETPPPGVAARLLSWVRSAYWNADRTAPLPAAEVGPVVLVHHEEAACFARDQVAAVYDGRVDDALLVAAGYLEQDGLLWQEDETHLFGGAETFFQRRGLERPGGDRTTFEYDAYALEITAQVDPLGNRTQGEIDYHTFGAFRVTDPNGNVSEARYDPLGVAVVHTLHGQVGAQPWGFEALAAVAERTPPDLADLLARPAHYLQGAFELVHYDLDAWRRDGVPPVTVTLTREELRHDGRGGGLPDGRINIELEYLDGLGRTLQTKTWVEAGPAIQRAGDGGVVVDDGGRPVLAPAPERWRVSGHVVYDAKQQPRRRYEPYFSPTWEYEGDDVLRRFGVASLVNFDALGREVAQVLPNGTTTETVYGPWSVQRADANDTVAGSVYQAVRQGRPADDPERQALEHAERHAGTPGTTHLDPQGRAVGTLQQGGATAVDRRVETRLDILGEAAEIVDPRGLTAFTYRRDMRGRALRTTGVDAGETWTFFDTRDRAVRVWDGRGFEVEQGYDVLDRPTTLHVRGGGLDHRVEDRSYGAADPASIAANLNGSLVRVRDQAGEVEVGSYDPTGQPLASTRRLRTATDEPDWRGAVGLDPELFVTETGYDALGRVRRAALPDGSIRTFSYRPGGGLEGQTVSTTDGKVVDSAVFGEGTYDAGGRTSRFVLGNGVVVESRYDPETFRLSRRIATGAARTLQDVAYTYDPVGNIVRVVDGALEGPTAIVTGSAASPRHDYEYDAHYRLTRASGRVHQALLQHDYIPALAGTIKGTRHITLDNGAAVEAFTRHFEYDASGNLSRVRHVGASRSWTTDFWISPSSNRSIPALDSNGVSVPAPETRFDASGNLIALEHLRRIEWSWRSTLARAVLVERPGDVDDDEVYTYGADGVRARKVATRKNGGGVIETVEKVYFGDCERKRITRGGALILERWTSHFRGEEDRVALLHRWTRDDLARETDDIAPARWRYQLTTHQGSSSVELDQAGDVVSYEEYFPYGGSAFIAGDSVRDVQVKEYRYSGKERDDATGLYSFGHRYYAPWMCRWASPDPIGPHDDLNLYQFVLGDPVGNVDPDGLDTTTKTRGRFESVEVEGIPEWARPTFLALTPEQRQDVVDPHGTHTLIILNGEVEYVTRAEGVRRLEEARQAGTNVTRYDVTAPRPPPPPPPEITPDTPVVTFTFEDEEADVIVAGPLPDQEVTLETGDGGGGPGGAGDGGRTGDRTTSGATSSGNRTRRRRGSGTRHRGGGEGGAGGSGTRGTGPGSGQRGAGPGGGGTATTAPSRPAAADGTGSGTSGGNGTGERGPGTGANPSAAPGNKPSRSTSPGSGDGTSGTGTPTGRSRRGSPTGGPNGAPGGVSGGRGRRPGTSGTGRATSTASGTGPSGTGTSTGGSTAPGLDPSATGTPAPPGLQENGTDSSGTIDGSPTGTRDGDGSRRRNGQPGLTGAGSPTGSRQGREGGSPQGQAGGDATSGAPSATPVPPESALDTLTRWAGYANFEFGSNRAGGQRGGVPGGTGSLNLGWVGQALYIGLTVLSWVGPGAILKGLRFGGRLAIKGLSWAGRGLAAGGRAVARGLATAAREGVVRTVRSRVAGAATRVRGRVTEWLWWLGDRGGSTTFTRIPGSLNFNTAVQNFEAAGTWAFRDTAAHEGFHALIGRRAGWITRAGDFTIRGVPVGAPVKWAEEVFAYGIGHANALRVHAIPFAPLEAFGSMSLREGLFTLGTFGVGVGAYFGLREEPQP